MATITSAVPICPGNTASFTDVYVDPAGSTAVLDIVAFEPASGSTVYPGGQYPQQTGQPWHYYLDNLPSPATYTVELIDRSQPGNSREGYLLLDTTSISPTCVGGVLTRQLTLQWSGPTPGPAQGYQVRYRAVGTTTYITLQNQSSPVVIYNLPDNTPYEGDIQAICGPGNTSALVTFTT